MNTACVIVAAGVFAGSVHGAFAVTSVGTGTESGSVNGEYGWKFTVTSDIVVTHLGVWDADEDGLEQSATTVRIWTGQQDVLVSATFDSANPGTLVDGFRYIDIDDIALGADEGPFTISANNWFASGQTFFQSDPGTPEFSDPIQLVAGTLASNPAQFPSIESQLFAAFFGPNFQFIPTPGTALLAPCAALMFTRRRR